MRYSPASSTRLPSTSSWRSSPTSPDPTRRETTASRAPSTPLSTWRIPLAHRGGRRRDDPPDPRVRADQAPWSRDGAGHRRRLRGRLPAGTTRSRHRRRHRGHPRRAAPAAVARPRPRRRPAHPGSGTGLCRPGPGRGDQPVGARPPMGRTRTSPATSGGRGSPISLRASCRGCRRGGSMSATAMVREAGARSRVANVVASTVMRLVILFFASAAPSSRRWSATTPHSGRQAATSSSRRVGEALTRQRDRTGALETLGRDNVFAAQAGIAVSLRSAMARAGELQESSQT